MKSSVRSGLLPIAGILIVAQYILAFFIYGLPGYAPLQWLGWGIWVFSAIFGIAPIYILRRHGAVAHGKSYVETTQLVQSSLYAIVRHPQYLGGMLFALALIFLAQQWVVLLLGITSIILIYIEIQSADQACIEKFGQTYRSYMQRVPQINFLLGINRALKERKSQ
jgi:protein-S-isoprenylcysteine O-methyltransferase Ste14